MKRVKYLRKRERYCGNTQGNCGYIHEGNRRHHQECPACIHPLGPFRTFHGKLLNTLTKRKNGFRENPEAIFSNTIPLYYADKKRQAGSVINNTVYGAGLSKPYIFLHFQCSRLIMYFYLCYRTGSGTQFIPH